MDVIVKESGFYGGTYYKANPEPVSMPDGVAKAFLPPHGHQLALPGKPAPKEAVKAKD